MRILAICGPIGSPVIEFAEQFPEAAILNEADYLNEDGSVNFEQIHNNPAKFVVLVGHLPFSHDKLRSLCDVKVFIETPGDSCLSGLLKGVSLDEVPQRIDSYLAEVKPRNEKVINPLCKYADLVIAHDKIAGPAVHLISTAFIYQEEATNQDSPPLNFFSAR